MATIDLNRVATFVRVVEATSFTAAARGLGVPVSSVSRSIAHLERDLGVRLLYRTTRKLSLTDSGRHFFLRMQTVIAEAQEATTAISGFADDPRGLVRLTAVPNLLGTQELPRIVAKLIQRYPGLVMELHLTNRVVDLVAEGIDLAIRGGALDDSTLVARKVASSALGVFGAPAYLDRRGHPRRPSDLVRHDCLRYGGRTGILPWRLSGPRGEQTVPVTGPILCDDMIFLRESVLAGLGLALLPVEIMSPALRVGAAVRVLPRWGVIGGGVYLVWPSQKLVPARVVVVRELLLQELARIYG